MAIRKTRNVSLTPELGSFVDDSVGSDRYRSASEAVRAGLRLLEKEERKWALWPSRNTKGSPGVRRGQAGGG